MYPPNDGGITMVKKGYFGKYKGIEYEVTRDMQNRFLIMTDDLSKTTSDFVDLYNSGVYTKEINQNELSEYYKIESYVNYKGHKFGVSTSELNGKVLIGTTDSILAEQLNFERTDKYYYEKWISKDDVTIIEERKDITT